MFDSYCIPMQKTEYEAQPLHIETIEKVIYAVCSRLSIERSFLFERHRKPRQVYARQLCIYLLSESMTHEEIGKIFEFTTVHVSKCLEKLKDLSDVYPEVKADLLALINDQQK